MTRQGLKQGLAIICGSFPALERTPALEGSWWAVLHDEFDDDREFVRAVVVALKRWHYGIPPPPGFVLEGRVASLDGAADAQLEMRAIEAFERIQKLKSRGGCKVYSQEGLACWLESDVAKAAGEVGALAFRRAGGSAAFRDDADTWLRKTFVQAYVALSAAISAGMALPEPTRRAEIAEFTPAELAGPKSDGAGMVRFDLEAIRDEAAARKH